MKIRLTQTVVWALYPDPYDARARRRAQDRRWGQIRDAREAKEKEEKGEGKKEREEMEKREKEKSSSSTDQEQVKDATQEAEKEEEEQKGRSELQQTPKDFWVPGPMG